MTGGRGGMTGRPGRAASRASLFQPTASADRRRQASATNQKFKKSIVLIPEYQPTNRPTGTQLADMTSQGFGELQVDFQGEDSVSFVKQRIYAAFPALQAILGGIQMYYQLRQGNATELKAFTKPVLTGSELKSLHATKIYIAPLLDESFPTAAVLTGELVQCPTCLVHMDMAVIAHHYDIW